MIPCVIRLAPEYFEDLLHYYAPIPLEVLSQFSTSPVAYSNAKWLWWRAATAQNPSTIRWTDLMRERGSQDTNVSRFRIKVRETIVWLSAARPEFGKLFEVGAKGLRINPLRELPGVEKTVS